MPNKRALSVLKPRFAICRLKPEEDIPDWAVIESNFCSVTRTLEELSIVCNEVLVPAEIKKDSNWRVLKVEGPLDFSLTGILSSILDPLAAAKISIFTISTFDTDYILVKDENLNAAIAALKDVCTVGFLSV